jgi:hypothetical protein
MVKRLKRRGLALPKPVDPEELEAALARMKGVASEEDFAAIRAVVDAVPVARAKLLEMHAEEEQLRKRLKKRGIKAP